eukprot:236227-Pelagomonas_calceolata.AAC.1
MSNDPSPQQKQYHAHYGPMIIEKWALPIFKRAGFHPASICTAARTDIECAYCQICKYHYGYESVNSKPPYPDMYAMCANGPTTGNARENLDAIMMSKGK